MKLLKALLATIGIFGFSFFMVWIAHQGMFGFIVMLAVVFVMVFVGIYGAINE